MHIAAPGRIIAAMSRSPLPVRDALSVPGLFSLSHHRASLPQRIRRVPIFRPTLIRVAAGTKQVWLGDTPSDIQTGQFIGCAARCELHLLNLPAEHGYLAEVLGIAPDAMEAFRQRHGKVLAELLAQPVRPGLQISPSPALADAWAHLLALWQSGSPPHHEVARHRLEEVLLTLALQGDGLALFAGRNDAWSERVRVMLQVEPARPWQADEVAARLHCSAATLRRHLAREGSSLRTILDAVRMTAGLGQVLNTQRPISDIAQACGYASASRFSIRFRQRFGASPQEMRSTL